MSDDTAPRTHTYESSTLQRMLKINVRSNYDIEMKGLKQLLHHSY